LIQEQKTNTRASFKTISPKFKSLAHLIPEKIGTRICPDCGTEVPIYRKGEKEISHCLTCDNKGLEKEMNEFKRQSEAEAFFWNNSLIPPDTRDKTFENYPLKTATESQIAAFSKIKWYAENFGQWEGFDSLMLQGSYGVGKSHLAHSAAMHIKSLGKKVAFINTKMLLRRIRNAYGERSKETEEGILQNIEKSDFLVIDDLGAEYVKKDKGGEESWGADLMLSIVESREHAPTIITTNYNSQDLKNKYGQHGGRIVSRSLTGAKVIKIQGPDNRLEVATSGW